MQHDITLRGIWLIKASLLDVFTVMTDFEKWPVYFPKVANSVHVTSLGGNTVEISAQVKSFGQVFPVQMKTQIIPGKGFISDNDSPQFGTSGHEEFLLSENPAGTIIDYTYQLDIHKPWLRILARPVIGWLAMKFWQKAVIDELRKRLEK